MTNPQTTTPLTDDHAIQFVWLDLRERARLKRIRGDEVGARRLDKTAAELRDVYPYTIKELGHD